MTEERFEEFESVKEVQVKLEGCDAGEHNWSSWFGTETGLARECKICHNTDFHYKGKFDKHGFKIRDEIHN